MTNLVHLVDFFLSGRAMIQVKIHEAKTHLSKLIRKVSEGEVVIISRGNTPVARLTGIGTKKKERKLGFAKGKIFMSDDFDEPLEDFKEYMY